MSLIPLTQARALAEQVAMLQAENDALRRRVQALEHERSWEVGYLTHVVAEMRAVLGRWA